MTNLIKKLGDVLGEAMRKPPSLPLHRHRDDDYCDRIEIAANGVHLRAHIVPRYKTSGLSGDEWRISARLEIFERSQTDPLFARGFHRMSDLLKYGPHHIYANARHLLVCDHASLIVQRKGVALMQQWFPTFGDAAMGMAWHIITANEGSPDVEWHHLTTEEELARCQQVGCGESPKNVYHLKKLQIGSRQLMVQPEYDFTGQFTWYCARHTERGDCSLEDCDSNLELVEGNGVAVTHASDESPSALGGIIELKAKKRKT